MKRLFIIALVVLLFPKIAFAAGTCGAVGGFVGSNPWTADSASYADVNYCINNINSQIVHGDTLNIPAGNVTWTSQLEVKKYMTISGAGVASTIITQGINDTQYGLVKFTPDSVSRAANGNKGGLFRVTGITFKGAAADNPLLPGAANAGRYLTSKGIIIYNRVSDYFYYNIRIDHCDFYHFENINYPDPNTNGYAIHVYYSLAAGVIDNCRFYNCQIIEYLGNQTFSWDKQEGYTMGAENAFYIEDCLFDSCPGVIQVGWGGRIVIRFTDTYNTIGVWSIWAIHGNNAVGSNVVPFWPYDAAKNSYNGVRGAVGAEFYKNKFRTVPANRLLSHTRGGENIIWGNINTDTDDIYIQLREEDDEQDWVPHVVSRNSVYYECILDHVSSAANGPPNATYWKTSPYQTSKLVCGDLMADHIWQPQAMTQSSEITISLIVTIPLT